MQLCTAAIAAAAMAALPAAASAVDRYATPDGVGADPCISGDPCSLETAVEGASTNDQVILVGGFPPAASFRGASECERAERRGGSRHHRCASRGQFRPPAPASSWGPPRSSGTSTSNTRGMARPSSSPAAPPPASSSASSSTRTAPLRSRRASSWATRPSATASAGPTPPRPNACGMEVRAHLGTANFTVNIRNSTVISQLIPAPGCSARTSGGMAAVNVTNSIVRSDTGARHPGIQYLPGRTPSPSRSTTPTTRPRPIPAELTLDHQPRHRRPTRRSRPCSWTHPAVTSTRPRRRPGR